MLSHLINGVWQSGDNKQHINVIGGKEIKGSFLFLLSMQGNTEWERQFKEEQIILLLYTYSLVKNWNRIKYKLYTWTKPGYRILQFTGE